MEEACGLCGRVFPYYTLRRCSKCGRFYCGDCTISTWDRDIFRYVAVCLNCARRSVSPRRFGGKYTALSAYLARRAKSTSVVTLRLSKIEEIIRDNLPSSAFQSEKWWMNSRGSVQGQAWLDVGWKVDAVDLSGRSVTFKRTKGSTVDTRMKARSWRRSATRWATKTPRPLIHPKKPRPSKTRISMVMARLKNIQREKACMRQYRGRLKPKTVLEKRLYKPHIKPE